jgi:uncharacterized protein YndB with AHSA1/START domain
VYATTVSGVVRASPSDVYRALVDAAAVAAWRVPDGMTAEVLEFDVREGGCFRVQLRYDDGRGGKAGDEGDVYSGFFERLVPDEQVVEVIEFDTDNDTMQGTMTLTTSLRPVEEGTLVELVHEGIPDGVPPDQNEEGTRMALANLAAYVEATDPQAG